MPTKLNLGAGSCPLPGYENLDRKTGEEIYPLARADESADEIRASHVLEHFSHRQTLDVLQHWVSKLKPGGVLKVAVPNYRYCAARYLESLETGRPCDEPLASYILGGHVDEDDHHGAIFDPDDLAYLLQEAGLVDIQPWESEIEDCAALPVSLNLMGTKPGAESAPESLPEPAEPAVREEPREIEIPQGAVAAVMSMPRLAFTDNSFAVFNALAPLGINVTRHQGVFWGQGLTGLFEQHLDDGTRYVLTIDYDTVFTKEDVIELLRLMETRPEIDALCAVQMRRDNPYALLTMEDTDSGECRATVTRRELAEDAMKIRTGHFGLTLLRVESLRRVAKPWFLHHPDPDGGWDERRTDEDIHFWHQWRAAGNTLYQANRCVVGHCQLMVTWPSKRLTTLHQYTSDYNRLGKPAEALS